MSCSNMALQDLELAALNRSTNCRKRAEREQAESISQRDVAAVARFLIDHRSELLEEARRTIEAEQVQTVLEFPARKMA